jgi:hypothetical protein
MIFPLLSVFEFAKARGEIVMRFGETAKAVEDRGQHRELAQIKGVCDVERHLIAPDDFATE